MSIEIGDMVKCIRHNRSGLTCGENYKVVDKENYLVRVVDNDGFRLWFERSTFELVNFKNNQIKSFIY